MNGYEKIIKTVRKNARSVQPQQLQTAVMKSGTSCQKGDLVLDRDDLLIAEHLLTGYIAADESVIPPLRKGDTVLIKRVSDEKYAIIERVK